MADGFGRLARVYEGLERLVYGDLLVRARLALLDELAKAERILIMGEGDGRFLLTLLKRHKSCRVTVLERSPGMVWRARRRLAQHAPAVQSRVTFWQADALRVTLPERSYDALVTHFFLDVFNPTQLPPLVAMLADSLEPGGLWLVGDFAQPGAVQGWHRLGSRLLLPLMYGFFRLTTGLPATTVIPPQPYLRGCGLERQQVKPFWGGFVYAELWQKPGAKS